MLALLVGGGALLASFGLLIAGAVAFLWINPTIRNAQVMGAAHSALVAVGPIAAGCASGIALRARGWVRGCGALLLVVSLAGLIGAATLGVTIYRWEGFKFIF